VRAIRYHGAGDLRLEQLPVPDPGPGELQLRVATVGICGTDVGEFVHGPRFHPVEAAHPHSGHSGPTIPGHEFSGWVTGVGEGVIGFSEGDLVGIGAGVACGICSSCLGGQTNLCRSYWTVGLHSNGGLAETAVIPASCSYNLSESAITPDLAALTQPMSIGIHATRRGRVEDRDLVTVLGVGGIGSFIVHAAAASGATVTAVDLDPVRLAIASRLGAASTYDVSAPELEGDLSGEKPTVVFECTGRPDSLLRAIQLVSDGGRVVVVGHQPEPVAVDFREVALDELEIIGTQAHVFAQDFPGAVDLIAADRGAWAEVAPTVYPLDQVVEVGLIPMAKGESPQIKVLFDPSADAPRSLRNEA
jgi:(R,R)-butanediol dehydrogenase / meso-butanediol dehydrogenase / diacetyl reductase